MSRINADRLKFGPFEVQPASREFWKNGVRLRLGGQPSEILAALLEKPGQLITRDELRKRIWSDDTFVDFNHGLNAAVNKLRDVLSDSAEEPRYIETVPRRGYRFIGKLEPEDTPSVSTDTAQAPGWQGSLVADEWEPEVVIKRRNLPAVWAVIAGIALLAILGFGVLTEQIERDHVRKVQRAEPLAVQSSAAPECPSIWHLDVAHAAEPEARRRIISAEGTIAGPQPSPDGKRLVYMSGLHNGTDLWVSNVDGSGARKLTTTGKCGTPRWSPDGRWIAFDSDGRYGHSGIYVVAADGGPVRPIIEDGSNNMVPGWSRDGKWIYFSSNRAMFEEEDLWKAPVDGGELVRVTKHGGFSASESMDGETLYFAKSRYQDPEIWRMPVKGGAESRVSSLLRPSTWANWAVTRGGILFLSEYSDDASTLEYFEFATRGVRPLAILPKASFWLAASSDGRSIWYSELTREQARLVFSKFHY